MAAKIGPQPTDQQHLTAIPPPLLSAGSTGCETPAPTQASSRTCIAFGHLIRMTIWGLGKQWKRSASWTEKLERVEHTTAELGGFEALEQHLEEEVTRASRRESEVREEAAVYDPEYDEVPF